MDELWIFMCDKSAISLVNTHLCRPLSSDAGRCRTPKYRSNRTKLTIDDSDAASTHDVVSYSMWTASPKQRVQLQSRVQIGNVLVNLCQKSGAISSFICRSGPAISVFVCAMVMVIRIGLSSEMSSENLPENRTRSIAAISDATFWHHWTCARNAVHTRHFLTQRRLRRFTPHSCMIAL